jgi:Asp-tRNA(Asn)/Glu-tRNA(Gln) amidotransferase A subunit family amidase
MRGSLLGIGTDIAGSIRIPALCCGAYGFKPTVGRIPSAGQAQSTRNGNPGFPACIGPLATSLRSTQLLMRSVLAAQAWDWDPVIFPVV